ncbi:MAG: ABC transporter permease [Acidimicrobiales bacterium]|jgi:osmoprotectant transport system permease protein|nr:ABC transporter permease [Acidimicrobiales bacterium]
MDALGDLWSFLTTADNWWGRRGILQRTEAHLWVSLWAIVLTAVLAVPPALLLGRRRRSGLLAVSVVNVGRALPTFAVLSVAFAVFVSLGNGISIWPTLVALVVLGIPPAFTNAYVGIRDVDRSVVDAATGMGMTGREVLRSVELPAATPMIIGGLRISAVQIVATATLGAFVGYQGLGSFILEGLAQGSRGTDRLLTGAVLVALLSVLTEVAFGRLERRLTPWRRPSGLAARAVVGQTAVTPSVTPGEDHP